jgi:ATP-dependent phosphofructokinase / diphosphate-dependent phosphofructokinase
MKNCIIAQSGGPTAVINASAAGILSANKKNKYFDNVYAGLNGIEGILDERIVNISPLTSEEIHLFKYTPSSGLGSCRYKMKDFDENEEEYVKLIEILKKYEIVTFFYIGGNDSMDTVSKLSEYVRSKNIDIQIIGIPKTIDNDLMYTDHTPGFGSAAKLIAVTVLESYLDSKVYSNNGIFILETMGRDTGWLAGSSSLAKINGNQAADFIYLPEVDFNCKKFIDDVRKRFNEKNHVFIVVSEGIKDETGKFISQISTKSTIDIFGHAQLGGVAPYLKNLILENKITSRVKTLEIGIIQRSAMHCASKTDIDEAFSLGKAGHRYSTTGVTGKMVCMNRKSNAPYKIEYKLIDADKVANNIKYFPKEWISVDGNNVTSEALSYFSPLIVGEVNHSTHDGLPHYIDLYELL